jgi:DNA-binding transcriptional LysR family regulator
MAATGQRDRHRGFQPSYEGEVAVAEVDLRALRYFVAVAEERNFTRAAERLMMTQPALSRAVRALETAVGVPLLVRGYRDVALTEAGEVLLARARSIDDQTSAAIRLARRAATAEPRVRVTAPGFDVEALDRLVSSFNDTEPLVPAVPGIVDARAQADQLRDGTADVGLMRTAPFDEDGLDSEEICAEPRVVVLRSDHALAQRSEVGLADVAHLPVIRCRGERPNPYLMWPPDEIPSTSSVAGPVIGESSEILARVLLGEGVAFVPESVAVARACPGVGLIRVLDCPPSTLRVVWRQGISTRSVAAFVWHASSYARWPDRPAEQAAGSSMT